MAQETVYIVQSYVRGRGKGLKAEQQVGCEEHNGRRRGHLGSELVREIIRRPLWIKFAADRNRRLHMPLGSVWRSAAPRTRRCNGRRNAEA